MLFFLLTISYLSTSFGKFHFQSLTNQSEGSLKNYMLRLPLQERARNDYLINSENNSANLKANIRSFAQ